MCIYYTLDFHGCTCRLRCPSKPVQKCDEMLKRRSKWAQKIFTQRHRRHCMVVTWETSKLKCPHCRLLEKFSVKRYDRALKEGLWVGCNGEVDMKLLERSSEHGSSDARGVNVPWVRGQRDCFEILYQVEISLRTQRQEEKRNVLKLKALTPRPTGLAAVREEWKKDERDDKGILKVAEGR